MGRKSDEINEQVIAKLKSMPRITLGPRSSVELISDPKHLVFVISRYKFISKMLANRGVVLEVGAGDGLGALIVAQAGNTVIASDIDEYTLSNMADVGERSSKIQPLNHDILHGPVEHDKPINAAYSLDVIEHIEPNESELFIENMSNSVDNHGVVIIGTPNETASVYASENANYQHINLFTMDRLEKLMSQYFHNVFMFGMNDEVVHTGFAPMCHYIFALGVEKRTKT